MKKNNLIAFLILTVIFIAGSLMGLKLLPLLGKCNPPLSDAIGSLVEIPMVLLYCFFGGLKTIVVITLVAVIGLFYLLLRKK
jgi:hypothetical protein